ncbi:alpha-hydroxy acid oxidase [Acuticoccus sp.]|uniref:alpha-hydroxy acid oxidase n=1 Tax=Acuticoccus sp. TaxID=1904378 RepID=UPI003B5195D9
MSEATSERTAQAPRIEEIVARRVERRLPRQLRGVLSLEDFEPAARRHLPRPVYAYVAGATESGASFLANREDFAALRFVPRSLAGHTERDQRRTIFGEEYAHPFGIAPMGLSALAAYDGDVVLARAAQAARIPAIMSASSLTALERVAREGGSRWFQAYLPGDDARVEGMVDRVAAAGYQTLVVTVDVPTNGNREHNVRNGFDAPMKPSLRLAWQGLTHPAWSIGTALRTLVKHGMPHFENIDVSRGPPIVSRDVVRSMRGREGLAWRHIELIRRRWSGKLVLKGILGAADTRLAREAGVDGVIVSNHGGRQLDGAISSVQALPDVIPEAGGMTVMLDCGVRRGTDVLKALALGADFVFVGRPFLFAAAIAGEAGVTHAIDTLGAEVDRNMTLLGIRSLSELTSEFVREHNLAAAGGRAPSRAGADVGEARSAPPAGSV